MLNAPRFIREIEVRGIRGTRGEHRRREEDKDRTGRRALATTRTAIVEANLQV